MAPHRISLSSAVRLADLDACIHYTGLVSSPTTARWLAILTPRKLELTFLSPCGYSAHHSVNAVLLFAFSLKLFKSACSRVVTSLECGRTRFAATNAQRRVQCTVQGYELYNVYSTYSTGILGVLYIVSCCPMLRVLLYGNLSLIHHPILCVP